MIELKPGRVQSWQVGGGYTRTNTEGGPARSAMSDMSAQDLLRHYPHGAHCSCVAAQYPRVWEVGPAQACCQDTFKHNHFINSAPGRPAEHTLKQGVNLGKVGHLPRLTTSDALTL